MPSNSAKTSATTGGNIKKGIAKELAQTVQQPPREVSDHVQEISKRLEAGLQQVSSGEVLNSRIRI